MAEMKTKKTAASVEAFLAKIPDAEQRADSHKLLKLMTSVSRAEPKMWGSSIVGFGDHHYKYASGREGDWFRIGFSPRKGTLTLYLNQEFEGKAALLKKLGKFKAGVGCVYIKRLEDVDLTALRKLMEASIRVEKTG